MYTSSGFMSIFCIWRHLWYGRSSETNDEAGMDTSGVPVSPDDHVFRNDANRVFVLVRLNSSERGAVPVIFRDGIWIKLHVEPTPLPERMIQGMFDQGQIREARAFSWPVPAQ